MERRPCEFFLVRYVPDTIKGEFINIGIILRRVEETGSSAVVRFTRNWRRVLCLDPDADVHLLEGLEQDLSQQFANLEGDANKLITQLESSLSNLVQISEPKGTLGGDLNKECASLLQIWVESRTTENCPHEDEDERP